MDIHQLTGIFCEIDDFCKMFEAYTQNYLLSGPMKGKRGPSCTLAISEIMTILVMFQSSRVRDFKNFYAGQQTGIYYIDSSCLPVCHIKRSSRHKTFDVVADYGHTSVGWFFGLKLHLVTNDRGKLMAFKITRGS